MKDRIKEIIGEIEQFTADNTEAVEAFRIKILGSKGLLKQLFGEFKNVEASQKKEIGQALNELRTKASEKIEALKQGLTQQADSEAQYGDLTRPGEPVPLGARHPEGPDSRVQIFIL